MRGYWRLVSMLSHTTLPKKWISASPKNMRVGCLFALEATSVNLLKQFE